MAIHRWLVALREEDKDCQDEDGQNDNKEKEDKVKVVCENDGDKQLQHPQE